jgi:hypothetical protein
VTDDRGKSGSSVCCSLSETSYLEFASGGLFLEQSGMVGAALVAAFFVFVPVAVLFAAVGAVRGIKWVVAKSTHYSIRELLILTTAAAMALGLLAWAWQ